METSVRHATAIALLAAGCGFSASSHAYSAAEDAEAQDQEVRAAYDRGYQAAREEMARNAATSATRATVAANAPAGTAAAAKQKTAAPAPILDIKHTYSDAGDVQKVLTLPITVKPLADAQDAAVPAEAQAMPPAPAPGQAATYADTAVQPARVAQQSEPRTYARAPLNNRPSAAAPPPAQEDVAPQESIADDEAVDDAPPRAAQVYSTQGPQYAQPQSQYAPPQPYGYAQPPAYAQQRPGYAQPPTYAQQQSDDAQAPVYAQRPAYAPPPQPAYYAPPAPWDARYQPQPQARWVYWSPQYGRWMYY